MADYWNIIFTVFVILTIIPGGWCKYDYDVGGLVAATAFGFIFLLVIIIMIVVIAMWRDWYMGRQAEKGVYRTPREEGMRGFFKSKKEKYQSELLSTPRSDRKMQMRMHNGSRNTTLMREPQPRQQADAWITQLPGPDNFEEKARTMSFEPEEEFVITTELMEDDQPYSRPINATQRPDQRVAVNPSYENAPPKLSSTQKVTQQQQQQQLANTQRPQSQPATSIRTTYVPLATESSARRASPQLRHTTTSAVQQPAAYVHAGRFSQTSRVVSGQEDIFIAPLIQASSKQTGSGVNQGAGEPDVVVFQDSDDEAGFIPNRNDDVLF